MLVLSNFDAEQFKQIYWQKKPGVFRQVFPTFEDSITPEELAGVALEPGVDSRIIWQKNNQWQVKHGPFDDYASLGEKDWTLLVQAVNEHYPPVKHLLSYFNWMPDWRIDDLMISFATPDAGVGPHTDQYDVFIIQGQGKRTWKLGEPGNYPTVLPHPELKQIPPFQTTLEVILEPGDMIYIPAGFPHDGISIDNSLSYSVGFRAPSQAELLSSLADYALDHEVFTSRYQDTPESLKDIDPQQPWYLSQIAIQQFKQHILSALDDDQLFHHFCAKLLSTNPRPPLPIWDEVEIDSSTLQKYIASAERFYLAPGVRWLTTKVQGQLVLWTQGEQQVYDQQVELLLSQLKTTNSIDSTNLQQLATTSQVVCSLLLHWFEEGYLIADYLYIEDEY